METDQKIESTPALPVLLWEETVVVPSLYSPGSPYVWVAQGLRHHFMIRVGGIIADPIIVHLLVNGQVEFSGTIRAALELATAINAGTVEPHTT